MTIAVVYIIHMPPIWREIRMISVMATGSLLIGYKDALCVGFLTDYLKSFSRG
jgi:hypothetical protein